MLGFGPGTIGRYGCVLTSICQAADLLRGVTILPPHLNEMGRQAKAFKGELVIWPLIARAAGLTIGPLISDDTAPALMHATIRDKGACLLHVDHKNDDRGDHWILAHSTTDIGDFICSDSATGDDMVISKATMRGATTWLNEPKVYAVRGVRTVFPLT